MSPTGHYVCKSGRLVKGLSRHHGRFWLIWQTKEIFIEPDERKALEHFQRVTKPVKPVKPQPPSMLLGLLRDYFGDERKARDFASHFAACTFSFPDTGKLDKVAREHRIVAALRRDPSKSSRRRTADFFGVRYKDLSRIFRQQTGESLSELAETHEGQK